MAQGKAHRRTYFSQEYHFLPAKYRGRAARRIKFLEGARDFPEGAAVLHSSPLCAIISPESAPRSGGDMTPAIVSFPPGFVPCSNGNMNPAIVPPPLSAPRSGGAFFLPCVRPPYRAYPFSGMPMPAAGDHGLHESLPVSLPVRSGRRPFRAAVSARRALPLLAFPLPCC